VGALGGLLFGFDTAVISGTTAGLTHAYGLSANQLGITVSIALVGTVLGAASAGALGQKYGSREMLRLTAILYVLSSIGCAFAPAWTLLLLARFLGGLGKSGAYPFVFFAAMMVLQFLVVLLFFPETKQVSLEDLQRKLKIT
jgi:SP family arabinose:H+ symporter-like MFS transporter